MATPWPENQTFDPRGFRRWLRSQHEVLATIGIQPGEFSLFSLRERALLERNGLILSFSTYHIEQAIGSTMRIPPGRMIENLEIAVFATPKRIATPSQLMADARGLIDVVELARRAGENDAARRAAVWFRVPAFRHAGQTRPHVHVRTGAHNHPGDVTIVNIEDLHRFVEDMAAMPILPWWPDILYALRYGDQDEEEYEEPEYDEMPRRKFDW